MGTIYWGWDEDGVGGDGSDGDDGSGDGEEMGIK